MVPTQVSEPDEIGPKLKSTGSMPIVLVAPEESEKVKEMEGMVAEQG